MRENRTSGSEGGEPVQSRLSYPYHKTTIPFSLHSFLSRPRRAGTARPTCY